MTEEFDGYMQYPCHPKNKVLLKGAAGTYDLTCPTQMAFDYKKEYKEFYMPKNKPSILMVPAMNYIAVRGHGDPNQEDGEYRLL